MKTMILSSDERRQAQIAMDMADVILFMVDGRDGMTHADQEVGNMLRRTGKKVILLVNKIDNPRNLPADFYDFYSWVSESLLRFQRQIC